MTAPIIWILSGTSINIRGLLQNTGAGAITLVAGWSSSAVTPQAIFGAVQADNSLVTLFKTTANSYGQTDYGNSNLGSILIGGNNASGNSAVGSAGGSTTLLTDNLYLEADNGYAQLGYHGSGGWDIYVYANGTGVNGNIELTTSTSNAADYALVGNGGLNGDVTSNVTGNIYLWLMANWNSITRIQMPELRRQFGSEIPLRVL